MAFSLWIQIGWDRLGLKLKLSLDCNHFSTRLQAKIGTETGNKMEICGTVLWYFSYFCYKIQFKGVPLGRSLTVEW